MERKRFETDCLCPQTRRAERIIPRIYDSFIKQSGLKSTQYGLFRCICSFTGARVADISAAMCMDQTTVSRNIAKLQRRGFIAISASSADPRRTNIRITELGYARREVARMAWEKAQLAVRFLPGEEVCEQLPGILGEIPDILDYRIWRCMKWNVAAKGGQAVPGLYVHKKIYMAGR